MTLKLITAPTAEPVSLAVAKLHLRIESDQTAEDAAIASLITMARETAEHELQRSLMPQTWERVLCAFPLGAITLGMPPVTGITSIIYIDASGAQQTLNSGAYQADFDTVPGRVLPAIDSAWPATRDVPNAVRVRFTAGYANAAAVPEPIKQWMLAHIGQWYCNRSASSDRAYTALPYLDRLLDRYRVCT